MMATEGGSSSSKGRWAEPMTTQQRMHNDAWGEDEPRRRHDASASGRGEPGGGHTMGTHCVERTGGAIDDHSPIDAGSSPWQAAALVCVFGAVGAHVLLVTAADPFPTTDVVLQLLLLGVSLSLLLGALLAYFLLTARGPEVAAGLYAAYVRRHRPTYALAALAALALAGAGGYRAALTFGGGCGGGDIGGAAFGLGAEWRRPGFYVLWALARCALLAFHCTAAAGAAASLVPAAPLGGAAASFRLAELI